MSKIGETVSAAVTRRSVADRDISASAEEKNKQTCYCVKIVITQKLNEELAGSQKRVYRGRILSPKYDPKVIRRDDALIGGEVELPTSRKFEGGMSVVVVLPDSSDDQQWERNVKAMQRESEILRRMDHKNIIGVVLPFQEMLVKNRTTKSFTSCMIIDAVRPLGFDLLAYLQMFRASQQTVPDEHVRWFVSQMHNGLQYIHDKKVVHRDLKPDQVLVDSDYRLKIIDFGYASAPGMPMEEMNLENGYLAPEVNHEKQPPSIDYWGMGVVVHSFYHDDWSVIHTELEAAKLDQASFWQTKSYPQWGQTHNPIPESVMDLRRGLLCINHDNRWGKDKLKHWLESSPVDSPDTTTQIFPWLGDVKTVFLLTLPADFETKTLGQLGLQALILMVDGPDGVDVRPGKDTKLHAHLKVYFAFKLDLSADVVDREIFQKLQMLHMVQQAKDRVQTDDNICDKLVQFARMLDKDSRITTLRPILDAFDFPDHCAGATLGPDGMDLRGKFEIPVVALARNDGSVVWWPGRDDVVHRGDQGLLMKDYQGFTVGQSAIVTLHMKKVSCLQDEPTFRKTLGLADDARYPWQTGDVAQQEDDPQEGEGCKMEPAHLAQEEFHNRSITPEKSYVLKAPMEYSPPKSSAHSHRQKAAGQPACSPQKAEENQQVVDVLQLAEQQKTQGKKSKREKGTRGSSSTLPPVDRRVDPVDGEAYSWEELSIFYKGKYTKKAIEEYYWKACKPARQ